MRRPSNRSTTAANREATAAALRTWRSAEQLLAEPVFDPDRDAYENAIAAFLPELDAAGSVPLLVERYGENGTADLPLATAACVGSEAHSGCELLPRVVLDTAFWR